MLSPRQLQIFKFIRGYISSNQIAPTNAEIRRQFQIRSPASVHDILLKLESEGLIKRIPNVSRGIQIVGKS